MNKISTIALRCIAAPTAADQSLKPILLLSGFGLVISFGLLAFGIDLTTGGL